ncbi:MAG: YybH family protein [Candidatus Hodarchaeota archaeon]
MKKNHSILIMLVLSISVLLLLGCAKKEQDVAVETAAIKKTIQAYVDARNSKDLTSWANTMAEDVVFQLPNRPQLNGKDAVVNWAKEVFSHPGKVKLDVQIEEVQVLGSWAFVLGRYTSVSIPEQGESTTERHGKFINIFRRESTGDWKYARFSFSTDAPLQPRQ